ERVRGGEARESDDADCGDRHARGGGAHAPHADRHTAPAPPDLDRSLELLERSGAKLARYSRDLVLEISAVLAPHEVRVEHLLRELRELAVQAQRDPLATPVAEEAIPRHESHNDSDDERNP